MPPRSDGWTGLLDAIEESLAAREVARRDGAPPPAALQLPATPGPIPPALETRARRLLDALADQQLMLAADLACVRAELARIGRTEAPSPRTVAAGARRGFEARA